VSSKQARFEGSNRQRRGVVLRALAASSQRCDLFDRDVVDQLVADGLVVRRSDRIELPS
jgi:A/G-specific adenine glycosylase